VRKASSRSTPRSAGAGSPPLTSEDWAELRAALAEARNGRHYVGLPDLEVVG